jgi:dUTP pyrophosphatase
MRVRIKKLHADAVLPKFAKQGDAGADIVSVSKSFERLPCGRSLQVYGTGLAFEIPEGFVGLLFPRSSISKTALTLTNSVGVLDSGYRGEVLFKFSIESGVRPEKESSYAIGDRIGQILILPYPEIEYVETLELNNSERGQGGFGSTGK